jgi:hypothetical protein
VFRRLVHPRCGRAAAAAFVCGILWLDASLAAGCQKGAKPVTEDQGGSNPAAEELVSQWLGVVRRATGFVEVKDLAQLPDGARVAQDSQSWTGRFLTPAANPYSVPGVRRSIHHATEDTFDVVRHEYEAANQRLVVEETVNFVLVTVDAPLESLQTGNENAKQDEINRVAAVVLKMAGTMVGQNLQPAPYVWTFRFPAALREGSRFSTDPGQDPRRMWSWASRVDGGIHQGRLYFLCFKKPESTSGRYLTPDGQHWFDGRCWDAFR